VKVLLSWSGGKDSAMSLRELQAQDDIEVVGLLTTCTEAYDRISMHGVRRELLEQQASRVGLPLDLVWIPPSCSNEVYAERMTEALVRWKDQGVTVCAFGDLFLEDIRTYRESNLAQLDMEAIFPIWKWDTATMARTFIDLGFRTVTCCVDSEAGLSETHVGRHYTHEFLDQLPPGTDPCGENGEFHTFVWDGPIFSEPLPIEIGAPVLRDGRFWYCDLT
jgi:uncharacterized protein (TIGR00290 family)